MIYLAGVADNIQTAVAIIASLYLLIRGGAYLIAVMDANLYKRRAPSFPIVLTIVCLTALIAAAAVPSKSTIYTMVAARTAQDIMANERVQTLTDNSLKVIEKAMGEYLNEKKAQ